MYGGGDPTRGNSLLSLLEPIAGTVPPLLMGDGPGGGTGVLFGLVMHGIPQISTKIFILA